MKSKEDKPSVSLNIPNEKKLTITESNSDNMTHYKNSLVEVAHTDDQLASRFKTKVLKGEEYKPYDREDNFSMNLQVKMNNP